MEIILYDHKIMITPTNNIIISYDEYIYALTLNIKIYIQMYEDILTIAIRNNNIGKCDNFIVYAEKYIGNLLENNHYIPIYDKYVQLYSYCINTNLNE